MIDRFAPTAELEVAAERLWSPNPYPGPDRFLDLFLAELRSQCGRTVLPAAPILLPVCELAHELWRQEGRHFIQPSPYQPRDTIEQGRYRDELLQLIALGNED